MSLSKRIRTLEPEDWEVLADAVRLLERPSFAARVAEYAGKPVGQLLDSLPNFATRRVKTAVTAAMFQSLRVALLSLDQEAEGKPSSWLPKLMVGVTGGLGGMFGLATLAV